MYKEISQELLDFLQKSPTAFHAVENIRNELLGNGFVEILESQRWDITPGGKYFVTRNNSSIIAFHVGTKLDNYGFNVAASHTDYPTFKIKENAEIFDFTLTDEEMALIATVNKHQPFYQVTKESLQKLATTKCNFEE